MSTSIKPEILTWVTHSQKRIFSDARPEESITYLSALKNEPISFGVAYRSFYRKADDEKIPDLPICISVACDGVEASVYKLGYIPFSAADCEDGRASAGICPDILLPRANKPEILPGDEHLPFYEKGEKHLLNVSCIATGGVLVTLNEQREALPAKDYTVTVTVTCLTTNTVIRKHELLLHVIDASLPASDLIYTNWFHYDCIADSHKVELYSDEYFEILAKYIQNAVKNGMNTLLTPCFTPALDTPVGFERRNVQLVKIKRDNGVYSFDFSLLERFVRLALDCGITYIEHCHLFSQWGALSAVNVYAEENGKSTRIFSWDDRADGEAYTAFLHAYLPAFLDFAKKMGIFDRLMFHISDEPKAHQVNDYARALEVVKESLEGHVVGDALSDYELYRQGVVETPVVSTLFADDFFGKCDRFMLYYTGGKPEEGLSNRMISSSPQKTRALGVQLFKYRSKGFLHWGYNYYYGRMCHGVFDPAQDPCGYRNMPGVSYLVYPMFDNTVSGSLREIQMRDAMSDYGALKCLETLIGSEETVRICDAFFGAPITTMTLPESGEEMLAFREMINQKIEINSKR